MKKFKKAFRFQLKFLPILGLIIITTGSIWYETDRRGYQKVEDIKEFKALALEHKIVHFINFQSENEERVGFKIPSGEKYYYAFDYYSKTEFEDYIIHNNGRYSSRGNYLEPLQAYFGGIATILGMLLFILSINIGCSKG